MFEAGLFAGQRILITGGGTGLGRAVAEKLLALGAEVHICGRRLAVCETTAHELSRLHSDRVFAHGLDIRSAEAVDALVERLFEDGPLTGLVNNAAGNFISRTEDLSPRGFDAIANIVMRGTSYVTHAVGRRWIARKVPGAVVSIIVTWVVNGGPFVVPSTMSKAAVQAMTRSLASEWGRFGIRLNTVGPGAIPTEGMSARLNPGEMPGERAAALNPMGRCGTLQELQNLVAFLMSDGCDWLTGQSIMMDGANHLANGGNFYDLRSWTDERWASARQSIARQDEKDRLQQSAGGEPASRAPNVATGSA